MARQGCLPKKNDKENPGGQRRGLPKRPAPKSVGKTMALLIHKSGSIKKKEGGGKPLSSLLITALGYQALTIIVCRVPRTLPIGKGGAPEEKNRFLPFMILSVKKMGYLFEGIPDRRLITLLWMSRKIEMQKWNFDAKKVFGYFVHNPTWFEKEKKKRAESFLLGKRHLG